MAIRRRGASHAQGIPNWGYYRVRAVKEGFASADRVFGPNREVPVTLHPDGTVPPGMVWVPAYTLRRRFNPCVSLPGFWIDRYEVTNRQFKEFVDAGGYRKTGVLEGAIS